MKHILSLLMVAVAAFCPAWLLGFMWHWHIEPLTGVAAPSYWALFALLYIKAALFHGGLHADRAALEKKLGREVRSYESAVLVLIPWGIVFAIAWATKGAWA